MGDMICEWFAAEFPIMCRMVGNMGEWELVFLSVFMLAITYALYVAAYNLWLIVLDVWYGRRTVSLAHWDDEEVYQDWMDEELWQR